jgi:hypothetical protein
MKSNMKPEMKAFVGCAVSLKHIQFHSQASHFHHLAITLLCHLQSWNSHLFGTVNRKIHTMPLQTMMTMIMMIPVYYSQQGIVVQHDHGLQLKFQEWGRASHSVLMMLTATSTNFGGAKSKASAKEGELHVSLLNVANSDSSSF